MCILCVCVLVCVCVEKKGGGCQCMENKKLYRYPATIITEETILRNNTCTDLKRLRFTPSPVYIKSFCFADY